MVKAESLMCTINNTSGEVVASSESVICKTAELGLISQLGPCVTQTEAQ